MNLLSLLLSKTPKALLISGLIVAACPSNKLSALPSQVTETVTFRDMEQSIEYEGIVIDAKTQETIIGATVRIKNNPQIGAVTDIDGKFRIKAKRGDILEISFVGYQTKEVKLSNITLLSVELAENLQVLNEVVVTAFGVGQKKESVVGSVIQVRPTELSLPSANLSNSFAGRLSGVVSFQRSGEPGNDGSTFYIRGISTINSSARSPLIIIDGVEASQGDLNALDPEIIEGFSILKDATATAMYGTRGANGVMIVTTKSGANMEKAAITARVEGYFSMPTNKLEFADPVTYMRLYNEADSNYGDGLGRYSEERIQGTLAGTDPYRYPSVDWYDELFKDFTFNQRANFNIRGGSKRIDYFLNANFSHETGMLKDRSREFYSYNNKLDVKRYTFQTNLNVHASKTATVSMNLSAVLKDSNSPINSTESLYGRIMNSNPVDFPIMYPTDAFLDKSGTMSRFIKWGAFQGGDTSVSGNPLADLVSGYQTGFASTIRANVRYKQLLDFITPGLSFNALVSFNNWSSTTVKRSQDYNKYYFDNMLTDPVTGNTNYIIKPIGGIEKEYTLGTTSSSTGNRGYYMQATLNYDHSFNDIHYVSAMLLYNHDQYDTNAPGNNLINSLPKRKQGLAARLSYNYLHKYMVELNMGYNGSENFAEGNRFGFFPSIGWGYNISEEAFFKPLKNIIDHFKIRGSFGLVGNADAGTRFLYMPIINLVGTGQFVTGDGEVSQGFSGPVYSRFENKKISWEVGHKFNIGLDFGLFNSLNLSLDYFYELRKDIFQQNKTIPNYMGVSKSVIYGNYGEVKNYGFEIAVDYGKQVNKDLSIQFKGTFSFARNKIQKYAEGFDPLYPNLSIVGQSIGVNKGYIYAGHLFMDEAEIANSPDQQIAGNIKPGDIKYVDVPNSYGETDYVINVNDQVYMGYPTVPEIIYGFGPSIQWKNWDFSVFFQGVANTSLMMSGFHPFGIDAGRYNRNVLMFIADDHWSPDNQNIYASYPRLTQREQLNNTANSSYWLRNGAFLKLKNAEIGYSWKNLRVYVSGLNLLTFSPFKYWDPEMGGGNGMKYPTQRTVNIGVQFKFN